MHLRKRGGGKYETAECYMFPFLLEITLCCIISYQLAFMLMQSEKPADKSRKR